MWTKGTTSTKSYRTFAFAEGENDQKHVTMNDGLHGGTYLHGSFGLITPPQFFDNRKDVNGKGRL